MGWLATPVAPGGVAVAGTALPGAAAIEFAGRLVGWAAGWELVAVPRSAIEVANEIAPAMLAGRCGESAVSIAITPIALSIVHAAARPSAGANRGGTEDIVRGTEGIVP